MSEAAPAWTWVHYVPCPGSTAESDSLRINERLHHPFWAPGLGVYGVWHLALAIPYQGRRERRVTACGLAPGWPGRLHLHRPARPEPRQTVDVGPTGLPALTLDHRGRARGPGVAAPIPDTWWRMLQREAIAGEPAHAYHPFVCADCARLAAAHHEDWSTLTEADWYWAFLDSYLTLTGWHDEEAKKP